MVSQGRSYETAASRASGCTQHHAITSSEATRVEDRNEWRRRGRRGGGSEHHLWANWDTSLKRSFQVLSKEERATSDQGNILWESAHFFCKFFQSALQNLWLVWIFFLLVVFSSPFFFVLTGFTSWDPHTIQIYTLWCWWSGWSKFRGWMRAGQSVKKRSPSCCAASLASSVGR